MISCVDIHLHLLAILMHMLNIIFALFLSCCFFYARYTKCCYGTFSIVILLPGDMLLFVPCSKCLVVVFYAIKACFFVTYSKSLGFLSHSLKVWLFHALRFFTCSKALHFYLGNIAHYSAF